MTDSNKNGKSQAAGSGSRRILAPHLWPHPPLNSSEGDGPLVYVSWAGWELYLTRKLDLKPKEGFSPLLLPDVADPERDCAAIDHLSRTVGELGTGVLALSRRVPESVPGLAAAIGRYREEAGETKNGPLLDDRSYLVLWSVNEFYAYQSDRLLADVKVREKAMWAALKGEEEPTAESPETAPPEADSRSDYAWTCWRRLAGPFLSPGDIIVPSAPRTSG